MYPCMSLWFVSIGDACRGVCATGAFWGCVCLHSASHIGRIVEMRLSLSALGALAQRCWATCASREDAELVYSNIMATVMKLFFNH